MKWNLSFPTLFLIVLAGSPPGLAAGPSDGRATSRILETQLTLRRGAVQARATVIAKEQGRLTVETAAHFLAREDLGKVVKIFGPGGTLEGRLARLAKNPSFHPVRARDGDESSVTGVIGVDSAVAVIELDSRDREGRRAFAAIRPAEVVTRRFPNTPCQILTVHIVDQFGEEHVVRAGNQLNPRTLAWGRASYTPRPGDSGSGVFVVVETSAGEARPILIGNVAQADDRGGIATLTHRGVPWIESTIGPGPTRPASRRQTEEASRREPPPSLPSDSGEVAGE